MRLTKKQRAEVVELLRCAADLWESGRAWAPIIVSIEWHDFAPTTNGLALLAADCAWQYPPDTLATLLEAAQRVDEGSWP